MAGYFKGEDSTAEECQKYYVAALALRHIIGVNKLLT